MNGKKTLCYIFVIISVIVIAQLYSEIFIKYLLVQNSEFYFPNFGLKIIGSLTINILMGMLFGLENFLKSWKKAGKWQVDFKKLLIIGVPLLLLSISYFNFYLLNDVFHMSTISLNAPAREPFFRFLLGYTIISSVYKEV